MTVEEDRLGNASALRVRSGPQTATPSPQISSLAPGVLGGVVAMAVVDPQGLVIEVSDRWCAITGWSRDAILGGHWSQLIHPEDLVETMAAVRQGSESMGIRTYESRIISSTGQETWVQTDALPLTDESGPAGWLIVALDVTGSKVVTDELLQNRRMLERLVERQQEHNARLMELDALKTDLVASVSHELRSPLTSIVSFTHLLRDGLGRDTLEDQLEFLEIIGRNSERLLRLVDDLLVLDRLESTDLLLDLEQVGFDELVSDAVASMRPVAEEKGVRLMADISGGPRLLGDKDRLGQMIDNLLSNAVKFTPSGGSVRVTCSAVGQRWRLEVVDTGIGIPTEEIGALFQRFYRASNAHHEAVAGSGLGLAIAHRIADLHRGTISIRSKEGKGTTFAVELDGVQIPGSAGPALARSIS